MLIVSRYYEALKIINENKQNKISYFLYKNILLKNRYLIL
jgi:hypothetical protein